MRYAIVAELGSGLRATFSKRGHVQWSDSEKATAFMKALEKPAPEPSGYRIPDYGLFGSRSVLNHIDPVVSLRMVPESEWSAAEHHTVPFSVEP